MVDQIVPVLLSALQRGVKVELHIDWVAQFYVHGVIKLLPRLSFKDRSYAEDIWEKNRQHVATLRNAGAEFIYTNQFNWWQQRLKIAGRNHQKIYAVDEKIVWFGGVNLLDASLRSLDVMLEFDEPVIVKAVLTAFAGIDQYRPTDDYVVELDDDAIFVVDAGRRNHSRIYDETLEMVSHAQREIMLISQFVPEGKLRNMLKKKAQDGVKVSFLTSPLDDRKYRTLPYRPVYLQFTAEMKNIAHFEYLHLPEHVHAKVIVVDGSEVLVGSHNLVETGIKLGTQEVAYRTRKREVAEWFYRWLSELNRSG